MSRDSASRPLVLLPIFGSLVALGPLTIDLLLPFLPMLQTDLRIGSAAAQLTITGATFGFAVGQLITGPLSDAIGRRIPLFASAGVHVIASLCAAATSDLGVLLVARFAQGAACTAAGAVVIAMARDLYQGRRLITLLANLSVIVSITPILVPAIGAQLSRIIDWRASFVVVAIWGVAATAAAMVVIPETLPATNRHPGGFARSLRNSVGLLRRRSVLALAAGAAAGWSISFSYLAIAPFMYTNDYHLDANAYGLVFAVTAVVNIVLAQSSGRLLIPRLGAQRVMMVAAGVACLGAGTLTVVSLLGLTALPIIVASLALCLAAVSINSPAIQYASLTGPAHEAGSMTAVLGAISFATAGVVAPIVGTGALHTLLPFAALVAVAAAVIAVVARTAPRNALAAEVPS